MYTHYFARMDAAPPDDVVALRALVASLRAEKETQLLLRRAIALAQRVTRLETLQARLRLLPSLLRDNYRRSPAVMDCDQSERWKFNYVLTRKHLMFLPPVTETQFRQLWDTGYLLPFGDDGDAMLWDRFDTGDVVLALNHIRPLTYAEWKRRSEFKHVVTEETKKTIDQLRQHSTVCSKKTHYLCNSLPCKQPHMCCQHI